MARKLTKSCPKTFGSEAAQHEEAGQPEGMAVNGTADAERHAMPLAAMVHQVMHRLAATARQPAGEELWMAAPWMLKHTRNRYASCSDCGLVQFGLTEV